MRVERTYNAKLVLSVLENPTIWDCIAEDGFVKGDYIPDVHGECWLAMYEDDDLIAVYRLHAHNSATVEGHTHVLPEFRKTHSKQTCVEAFKYVLTTPYHKVIVQIPEIYQNVIDFVKMLGFRQEGINHQSYLKDGKYINQIQLGITKPEIEDYLSC